MHTVSFNGEKVIDRQLHLCLLPQLQILAVRTEPLVLQPRISRAKFPRRLLHSAGVARDLVRLGLCRRQKEAGLAHLNKHKTDKLLFLNGVFFFLLDIFLDLFESKWLYEYKTRWNNIYVPINLWIFPTIYKL